MKTFIRISGRHDPEDTNTNKGIIFSIDDIVSLQVDYSPGTYQLFISFKDAGCSEIYFGSREELDTVIEAIASFLNVGN